MEDRGRVAVGGLKPCEEICKIMDRVFSKNIRNKIALLKRSSPPLPIGVESIIEMKSSLEIR